MPIGSVWAAGSWADAAWEEGSWAEADAADVAAPGGVFRRPRYSWSRVWRYTVPQLPAQTLTPVVGDDRDYLIDCSPAPEVAAGATVASAAVVHGTNSGGLVFGALAPNAATLDGIAAGKAVVVPIAGWAAGTVYTFGVLVTLSTGRKFAVPCRAVPGGAA